MRTKDKDENKVLSNLLSCYPILPWFLRRNLILQLEATIHNAQDITKLPQQVVRSYTLLRYLCPNLVSLSKTIPSWDSIADDCDAPVIEEMDADKTLIESLWDVIPRVSYGKEPIPVELRTSPLEADIKMFSNFALKTIREQGIRSANEAYSYLKSLRSPKGFNYLHAVVATGSVDTIAVFPELVNQPNYYGWTPLHEAAYR